MKLSINPKAKRLIDLYLSLTPEKREALDKVIEAFAKENHKNEGAEETQIDN